MKYVPKVLRRPIRLLRALPQLHFRIYRRGYTDTHGQPLPIAVRFLKTLRETSPHVLMFGDSVSLRVAHQDSDRRTLGHMVSAAMVPKQVQVTSFTSYTSYMHAAFIALANRLQARPEWVVLPYNLRCTSPQWDGCPVWQYTQENAVVQALITDPAPQPGAVAPVFLDNKVYDSVAFSSPLSAWRSVGPFRKLARNKPTDPTLGRERLRQLLVLHYGQPVTRQHRQIVFLCSAIREAASLGAQVLVYVTPINVDFMRELWGDELLSIVEHNCNVVRTAIEEAGLSDKVIFEDWSAALRADEFFHAQETTEHLAQQGRLRLASLIVETTRIGTAEAAQ